MQRGLASLLIAGGKYLGELYIIDTHESKIRWSFTKESEKNSLDCVKINMDYSNQKDIRIEIEISCFISEELEKNIYSFIGWLTVNKIKFELKMPKCHMLHKL